MKRINYYLIFFFFVLVSCAESKFKNEKKALNEIIDLKEVVQTKKCILVIPMNGCGTFTEEIISFSKENYASPKLSFILSGLNAQNILTIKNIKNYQNYYVIDEYSALVSLGLIENKPIAFFIDNNQIIEKIIFDDNNVKSIIDRINKL